MVMSRGWGSDGPNRNLRSSFLSSLCCCVSNSWWKTEAVAYYYLSWFWGLIGLSRVPLAQESFTVWWLRLAVGWALSWQNHLHMAWASLQNSWWGPLLLLLAHLWVATSFRPSSDNASSMKSFWFCAHGCEPFLPQIPETLYLLGSNGIFIINLPSIDQSPCTRYCTKHTTWPI